MFRATFYSVRLHTVCASIKLRIRINTEYRMKAGVHVNRTVAQEPLLPTILNFFPSVCFFCPTLCEVLQI